MGSPGPLELGTAFPMENPYGALPCLSDEQDTGKALCPCLDVVDIGRAGQGLHGAVGCLTWTCLLEAKAWVHEGPPTNL